MSTGVIPSIAALGALFAVVAILVGGAVVLRRRRRRTRLQALAKDYQYWEYLQRDPSSSAWEPTEFVGQMYRTRPFGRGLNNWHVYRFNRLAAARRDARSVESGWFHAVMHFIPRQIRSPWFDHLLDDRERMAVEGRSRRFIAAATAVQCLSLVVQLLWERVWDVLTPFKPRSD